MMLEEFSAKLQGLKWSGDRSFTAKCPAHDDGRNSLSASQADGKLLVKCHAGCETRAVLEATGLQMSDLFTEVPKKRDGAKKIVNTYDYVNAEGILQYQVLRYEPKDFRQRRPDPDKPGRWIWNLKGVDRILYNLPSVREGAKLGEYIFLTEGEKDADALIKRKLRATTNAGGAAKWSKSYTKELNNSTVIILPDNDEAGEKHAKTVAAELDDCVILRLPGLPPKGDVSDWFAAGGTREALITLVHAALKEREEAAQRQSPENNVKDLPHAFLPNGVKNVTITESAGELGSLCCAAEKLFRRGDSVVDVCHDDRGIVRLRQIKPVALASILESVAQLVTTTVNRKTGDVVTVPKNCSKANAELISNARAFLDLLPLIRLLTRCPVLVDRDGKLVLVEGYDRKSGIYASGGSVENMSLEEAKELLSDMLADFQFATPADRSRALAALVTPALVHGGLLGGRAPLDLSEADQSQTGKGYRAKLTAATYNDTPRTITQRQRGTGGLEESFSSALLSGAAFPALDNIRGKLDCPSLESALTEDFFMARAPYLRPTEVDMRRIVVSLTSNRSELTPDLANRASPVLLRKQAEGHEFKTYPDGADILEHVRRNQGRYLGAVFFGCSRLV